MYRNMQTWLVKCYGAVLVPYVLAALLVLATNNRDNRKKKQTFIIQSIVSVNTAYKRSRIGFK